MIFELTLVQWTKAENDLTLKIGPSHVFMWKQILDNEELFWIIFL